MKMFRTHTTRISSLLLLLIGMALHFAKPANDKATQDAFTSWLGSHLNNENDSVLNQLEALSSETTELKNVILEASKLVLSNSEDFELPISGEGDESQAPEDVYQLLLTQWQDYQNSSNGMGNAVFVQNTKPQTVLPTDGHFLSSAVTKRISDFDIDRSSEPYAFEETLASSFFLSPHKSGTAIGAP